ncbi:MAG: sigma-70 family RNA polymerase sigma factor [Gemmatimonadetes bacterium]|nr:sigma-70 family RNA polymerase sigma factor [Gemmatimonadota bacterium]
MKFFIRPNVSSTDEGGRLEAGTEGELIRQCRAGQARSFEPLVRAHEADALRVARALLGDIEAARDAAQDAFVKAWRSLSTFDESRRFRPWLLQIVRNQCRDAARHRRVRRSVEVPERVLAGAMDRLGTEDTAHRHREARELLWKGLDAIEPMHREVLVMKELEGLGYAEIAAALGIPEGTVASRLYHARRSLRAALERLGITYP